ncbi:hypothetical protein [Paenibacillus sp. Soil522]|uniref:hypothetical protein n=1 Tax=Paenibacillus sp. Soil522 TaxID=1736388 RepID=UPI0006FD934B|nr:hypothetical protein [Paenibacillus sp. Soil522]KRE32665.1 hypothetical protein ASG81_24370 [Paenibacillus sp. Soil522]
MIHQKPPLAEATASVSGGSIHKKTGLTTYSGPHFSTFGMLHGNEYTELYFKKIMIQDELTVIQPAKEWSDDLWYLDQVNRSFIRNEGPYAINHGKAEGTIIGGNLCTLKELDHIPVITDADFGHTTPQFTLPIGGYSYIKAYDNNIEIIIED